MKQFLLESFQFNDRANLKMLEKIRTIPDSKECVRHFSHLINSQLKWMARINGDPLAQSMSWWDPEYPMGELEYAWEKSLMSWIEYLDKKSETEILGEVTFTGYDGAQWMAKISDIALQLNYHSFHHRGQMQLFIRAQGIEPDFIDYIGSKYRRIG